MTFIISHGERGITKPSVDALQGLLTGTAPGYWSRATFVTYTHDDRAVVSPILAGLLLERPILSEWTGAAVTDGFALGYSGEGPHGTLEALAMLMQRGIGLLTVHVPYLLAYDLFNSQLPTRKVGYVMGLARTLTVEWWKEPLAECLIWPYRPSGGQLWYVEAREFGVLERDSLGLTREEARAIVARKRAAPDDAPELGGPKAGG